LTSAVVESLTAAARAGRQSAAQVTAIYKQHLAVAGVHLSSTAVADTIELARAMGRPFPAQQLHKIGALSQPGAQSRVQSAERKRTQQQKQKVEEAQLVEATHDRFWESLRVVGAQVRCIQ
jgi:hypothetical protein